MAPIVQDIEKAQATPERTVYEEKDFLTPALKSFGNVLSNIGKGSGGKKTNFQPLYKLSQEFQDEVNSKGIEADTSEYIELKNKYQLKASGHAERYTPEQIERVFTDVVGNKQTIEAVESLLEKDKEQRIGFDEEAMLIGQSLAPDATRSEQTSLGRRTLVAKMTDEALQKFMPAMSAKERADILESSPTYRGALQTIGLNSLNQFVKDSGGVLTPDVLDKFKKTWAAGLAKNGFPSGAAQTFVDNTLAIVDGQSLRAAKSTDEAAKYTANVMKAAQTESLLNLADISLTLDKKTVKAGTILAAIGYDFGSPAGQAILAKYPTLLAELGKGALDAKIDNLNQEQKNLLLSSKTRAQLHQTFMKGSEGSKAVDGLSGKTAEEAYQSVVNMDRETLAGNSMYNSAVNIYNNSHTGLDMTDFSEQDRQKQESEWRLAARTAAKTNNTFLQGLGMVLLDATGTPQYVSWESGQPRLATNDGEVIEWLDNDSVDARRYVFGGLRSAYTTASRIIGMDRARDIWNEEQNNFFGGMSAPIELVRSALTSAFTGEMSSDVVKSAFKTLAYRQSDLPLTKEDVLKKSLSVLNKPADMMSYPDRAERVFEYRSGEMSEPKAMPVKNPSKVLYDSKVKSMIFETTGRATVTAPVEGTIANAYGNPLRNVYSLVLEEKGTGNKWTISGTNMAQGLLKAGTEVKQGDKIGQLQGLRNGAVGIMVRTAEGRDVDPRKYFGITKEPEAEEPSQMTPVPEGFWNR